MQKENLEDIKKEDATMVGLDNYEEVALMKIKAAMAVPYEQRCEFRRYVDSIPDTMLDYQYIIANNGIELKPTGPAFSKIDAIYVNVVDNNEYTRIVLCDKNNDRYVEFFEALIRPDYLRLYIVQLMCDATANIKYSTTA